MSDSIKVAIKVRPLIKREKDDNLLIQWTVQENSIIATDPEMRKRGDGGFVFDHIFDMNTSNLKVFETIVKPIVNAAVNGFNGTVFAYGQTSSGKTYTMMGCPEEPGIIPLAVEHMFDAIANTIGREFLLRVSYLEIYNEKVNDLLNKGGTDLKLKEDGTGQVVLKCKEEITNCPENVLALMQKGDKNRRIGETNMNERSSRSHTIFRITIESREAGSNSDGAIQVSQLNLVDLAGSERARQTGATGERFKEGRHINMSLTTLGLVIMQLSESQDGQKYVNFRDSKLTRLLQASLGGNAMTAIICAVTPAALEETQCTLSFASRAKSVKNKPQVNEVMSDAALLKRYAKQLTNLQKELERIKNENRVAEVEEMESKLLEKDRINQLLEQRIELLKTRIVSGDNVGQEGSFKCKSKRRQTWGGPGLKINPRLSLFKPTADLPTIREVSFEKLPRKSIIQSMDIVNQTFETAFADFELELFESERNRESRDTLSDSDEEPFVTKRKNRVTFRDDVVTFKSRNNSLDDTPEKCNTGTQTSDQISPSTPKHVLRRCISDLTKEFVELREFTTLEKQMIYGVNKCHVSEEEEPLMNMDEDEVQNKEEKQCISQVKQMLINFNLHEERNMKRVISELCCKLKKVMEEGELQKETCSEVTKRLQGMEKQLSNIISERNEFEYLSSELRAQLNKKVMELELKNVEQEEQTRIVELERQVEEITSKKNKIERINKELQAESTKKITELEKQVTDITAERNEFDHMRCELSRELNKRTMELEALKNNMGIPSTEEMENRIKQLEMEIQEITSERNALENLNAELHTELKQASSEFELKITSELAEKGHAIEKYSQLEKRMEEVMSQRDEQQHLNAEKSQEIASERTLKETEMRKVSELQGMIENINTEKKRLELAYEQLNDNVEDLKSKISLQQSVYQEAVDKISLLEREIAMAETEKCKLQETNTELSAKLAQETSELENRIATITSEKSELEKLNQDLQGNLQEKLSLLESQTTPFADEIDKARERIYELENEILKITAQNDEKKASQQEEIIATPKEETENKEAVMTISDLKSQIEALTLDKEKLENLNDELQRKLEEKVSELQKEMQIPSSENNEGKFANGFRDKSCKKDSELETSIDWDNKSQNTGLQSQFDNESLLSCSRLSESTTDASFLLCLEKSQLEETLQLKSQELEEIKNDVRGLKNGIKQLEETVLSLTTENMEMSGKLKMEQEKASQIKMDLQRTIDDLRIRISEITNEKIALEKDLNLLNQQLKLFVNKDENKESECSGSVSNDHDCLYKKKVATLTEQNEHLLSENSELSSDLMDKIEENETLRQQCNMLKSKMEDSLDAKKTVEEVLESIDAKDDTLQASMSPENEVQDLENKLITMTEEIEKLSAREKEWENHRSALQEELINLQKELQIKDSLFKEQNEEISSLEVELNLISDQKNELNNLRRTTEAEKEEFERLRLKYETLQKDKMELEGQAESRIKELESQINDLQTALSNQEKELEHLRIKYETSQKDKMELEGQAESRMKELEFQKDKMELEGQAESRIKELESQINDLQTALSNQEKELEHLRIKYETLQKDKMEIERQAESRMKELEFQKDKMKLEGQAESRIKELESQINDLQTALSNQEKELEHLRIKYETLQKDKMEIEQQAESRMKELEFQKDKMKLEGQAESRIKELESQINDLQTALSNQEKELEHLRIKYETLQKDKMEIEQQAESRIKELECQINDLQTALSNQERVCEELQKKSVHVEELFLEKEQEFSRELTEYKTNLEMEYRNQFDAMSQEYRQRLEESESNLEKLNEALNRYMDENMKLIQEISTLRSIKEKYNETISERNDVSDHCVSLNDANEKLKEQLDDIRTCMIRELRSLKFNTQSTDISNKSLPEIFTILLQTFVAKETEILESVRNAYKKELKKLEEEKQQSINSEKRSNVWCKQLEADIERLQMESKEQEETQKEYVNRISHLEHLLTEATREREIAKEKMDSLLMDLNNLQGEYDKHCKMDDKQEEAVLVAQRREKEAQEILKNKEIELQAKLNAEKETCQKKINDLLQTVEALKTKNIELNSTVEGFEANEKQLRNLLEANSFEINRNRHDMENMSRELKQLTQAYNEVSQELAQKKSDVEEITTVFKKKCDTLYEYKTKLESILPEYETLKEHVRDKKLTIERCKKEIESLKNEREEQLEIIKDKLNSEEIKNAGLEKQLNELNNKNIALIDQLNELNERYGELQTANAKLERKIRNSTSKIHAESLIEELKEQVKKLQSNLDGASNRVTELMEARNRALKDFADLKEKFENVSKENNELKDIVCRLKSKESKMDEDKYNTLLSEKNRISLELEGKTLVLEQREKDLKEYVDKVEILTKQNKELDEELDNYSAVIIARDAEISKLEEKVYSRFAENELINELEEKLRTATEKNKTLQDEFEALKMRLEMNAERDVLQQHEQSIRHLIKENLQLKSKVDEYKKLLDKNRMNDDSIVSNRSVDSVYNRLRQLEEEKIKIAKSLESKELTVCRQEKELQDYLSKIHDLTNKNQELDRQLKEYAKSIENRGSDISKFENKLQTRLMGNDSQNDFQKQMEFSVLENSRLKSVSKSLHSRLATDTQHDKNVLKENVNKFHGNVTFEKSSKENEELYDQLKRKIRELELQLVSKNGQIATLELQIQSESFPYRRRSKELEEQLLAFRSRNIELMAEVKKLRSMVNDVNTLECDVCRRWRINRKDQACQTIPSTSLRLCSSSSGVVEDHVKIQKLEKEKVMMKDLCRSRNRQIKELEERIKDLEKIVHSSSLNEMAQGRSSQPKSSVSYCKTYFNNEN